MYLAPDLPEPDLAHVVPNSKNVAPASEGDSPDPPQRCLFRRPVSVDSAAGQMNKPQGISNLN